MTESVEGKPGQSRLHLKSRKTPSQTALALKTNRQADLVDGREGDRSAGLIL